MTHLTRLNKNSPPNGVEAETWEPYTNLQPQSPPVVARGVGVSPLGWFVSLTWGLWCSGRAPVGAGAGGSCGFVAGVGGSFALVSGVKPGRSGRSSSSA